MKEERFACGIIILGHDKSNFFLRLLKIMKTGHEKLSQVEIIAL